MDHQECERKKVANEGTQLCESANTVVTEFIQLWPIMKVKSRGTGSGQDKDEEVLGDGIHFSSTGTNCTEQQ